MSEKTPTQPYDRAVEAASLSYSTPEGVADAVLTAALGDRDQIAHALIPDAFPPESGENIGRAYARDSAYRAADRLISWLGVISWLGGDVR